jgi:hypothetical protein
MPNQKDSLTKLDGLCVLLCFVFAALAKLLLVHIVVFCVMLLAYPLRNRQIFFGTYKFKAAGLLQLDLVPFGRLTFCM